MITLREALIEVDKILDEIDGEDQIWSIGIQMHKSNDGEGVVLFYRAQQDDYGTLRWGCRQQWPGNVHLFEGHYDIETYEEAVLDFESRVAH